MKASNKIIIVGAGIGGLAAALALLKRGLDVEIYEQAPELKEVGAGIQISSNGTRVLYALGLEDALKRVQVLPPRRVIRHWSTGETWNWFDLGAVTRAALRHAACDAAPGRPARASGRRREGDQAGRGEARPALRRRRVRGRSRRGPLRRWVERARGLRDRRRRHPLQGARGAVRRRQADVHRRGRVARPRADGEAAAASAGDAGRQLARAARPCAALSGAARRDHELHQLRRARRLAGRILGDAGHQGRARQRFPRLARRRARDDRADRDALQMGDDGARADAALEQGPRHAAGRRLPSDACRSSARAA